MTNKGQAIMIIIIIITRWGDTTNPPGLSTVATCSIHNMRKASTNIRADSMTKSIIRKCKYRVWSLDNAPIMAGSGKVAARQIPGPHYILTNKLLHTNDYHCKSAAHLSLHNPGHAHMLGAHRLPNPCILHAPW